MNVDFSLQSKYDVEIVAYRNSPEYKNYLKAKSDEEQAQQAAGAAASAATPAPTAPVKTASPTPPPHINNVRLPTQPVYVPSPGTTVQVIQQQQHMSQQQQQGTL